MHRRLDQTYFLLLEINLGPNLILAEWIYATHKKINFWNK